MSVSEDVLLASIAGVQVEIDQAKASLEATGDSLIYITINDKQEQLAELQKQLAALRGSSTTTSSSSSTPTSTSTPTATVPTDTATATATTSTPESTASSSAAASSSPAIAPVTPTPSTNIVVGSGGPGKRIVIAYMSTTGNTRYVAQTLADLWKDKPAISLITLVDITGPQRPDTTPFKTADVVGIGTLTWGLREPPRVRDFITGMDPAWVKDKPCFVFTTARVMAGNVCSNMLSALHKKNGITVGYLELLAPGNFYGLPAQGKRTVWGMDERKKIAPFAEKMHALFLSPKKHSKSGSLFSSAFSSLLLSDAQIKEMVGEVLFSSSKCVRCGLCARQCPFGAISMNESGPVWTKAKCESCSRCFNYCPKQAIVYSKLDPNFAQYRFIPGKTPVDGSFNTKEVSNS